MSGDRFVWTPEKLTTLLDAYEKGGRELAAETLGCSVAAAQTKMSRMKSDMAVPYALRRRAQAMKNPGFEKFAEIREEKERLKAQQAKEKERLAAHREQRLQDGEWTPMRIDWAVFPPKIENWRCLSPNGWTISVMIPRGHGHGEVVAWPVGAKARGPYVDDYFVFEDGYSQARVYDQAEVAARVAEICRASPPPPAKGGES